MATKLHNDAPVPTCGLGRDNLVEHIKSVITHCQAPKTFAIHGTWGTGKTSMMAQLYTELGGDYKKFGSVEKPKNSKKTKPNPKIQAVWFDAWVYQNEENILVPLLHEIRTQLTWKYKFLEGVKETVVPGFLAALQSIDLTLGKVVSIKGFGEKFVKNEQEYLQERFSNELGSEMMRRMLQEAVAQLLGLDGILYKNDNTDGRKLVVFIDDLDRCEPDTAFKVLEAIKLYLNLENCVFVLGMDMQEVERMLGHKYEKQNEGVHLKNHARLYLEKICQDVFHLPVLDSDTRYKYFKTLLQPICDIPEYRDHYHRLLALVETYQFLPPFPRSIKMLANTVISHIDRVTIFHNEKSHYWEFMILAYLYTFHYEVYLLIYLHLDRDFYTEGFLKYCNSPTPDQFKSEVGEHPVLTNILLPRDTIEMEGNASKEIESFYPSGSLRQWLWIRKLVVEQGTILRPTLEALKF